VVDVGSFFIGVGEANAAVKGAKGANAATHVAEGLHAARGVDAAATLTEVAATAGKNAVKWSVDAEGRTIKAEASLKEVFANAARSSTERNAQSAAAAAGESSDVGGHIIGHRFVKNQGPVNLFPQDVQFNNSAYRTLENEWASWVKQGKEVDVQVSLSGGTATRPDRINVRYVVKDPASDDVVYARAKPFANEAGQTFDRVHAKDMLR
jgi:DNA/RNA non-specific endonuclease